MSRLWTLVDINRTHEKFGEYKLLIADRNWNDYGYYTRYSVYYQQANQMSNPLIAELKIFKPNQIKGEKASFSNIHAPYVTFISNKISAMVLFLILSPKERKDFIDSLHITFDCSKYKSLDIFNQSILREHSLEHFISEQNEIHEMMVSEINPAHYISSTDENDVKNVLLNFSEVVKK